GVGKRMNLKHTRALITAALNGALANAPHQTHEVFRLAVPLRCPDVPTEVLNPRNTWRDKDAYDQQANQLAASFLKNFKKFSSYANDEIMAGAPHVNQFT